MTGNINHQMLLDAAHRLSPTEIDTMSPQEILQQVASHPIEISIADLHVQKTTLETMMQGPLTLLQQHALSNQVDESASALRGMLYKHPDTKNLPQGTIDDFVSKTHLDMKHQLDLPHSLPSLNRPKPKTPAVTSNVSTSGTLGKHSVSALSKGNPLAGLGGLINKLFGPGGLFGGTVKHQAPTVAKDNYEWIDLCYDFHQAASSGEVNKAMLIYQKLSAAINQGSSPTSSQKNQGPNMSTPLSDASKYYR